jgi:hypothetical protein
MRLAGTRTLDPVEKPAEKLADAEPLDAFLGLVRTTPDVGFRAS